jgi:hypothetical protein
MAHLDDKGGFPSRGAGGLRGHGKLVDVWRGYSAGKRTGSGPYFGRLRFDLDVGFYDHGFTDPAWERCRCLRRLHLSRGRLGPEARPCWLKPPACGTAQVSVRPCADGPVGRPDSHPGTGQHLLRANLPRPARACRLRARPGRTDDAGDALVAQGGLCPAGSLVMFRFALVSLPPRCCCRRAGPAAAPRRDPQLAALPGRPGA